MKFKLRTRPYPKNEWKKLVFWNIFSPLFLGALYFYLKWALDDKTTFVKLATIILAIMIALLISLFLILYNYLYFKLKNANKP